MIKTLHQRLLFQILLMLHAWAGIDGTVLAAPPQRGITLGLHSKDPAYDYAPMLDEIRDVGANWVSLSFDIHLVDVHSDFFIYPMGREAQFRVLRRTIRQAHERGLKVLLFPLVVLMRSGEGEWRGVIDPPDRVRWHSHYRHHLAEIAGLAARCGVEGLVVGAELNSFEADRTQWLGTIGEVRQVFHGQVLYSANWDHYEYVTFWDAVDAVAISGYYELSDTPTPTLEMLVDSWRIERKRLLGFFHKQPFGTPLVFTEVGYPNLDGASMAPWNYTLQGPADPHEQALCYQAFIETWQGIETLQGVFFYNWWPGRPDSNRASYSPQNQPAEALIRTWYTQE